MPENSVGKRCGRRGPCCAAAQTADTHAPPVTPRTPSSAASPDREPPRRAAARRRRGEETAAGARFARGLLPHRRSYRCVVPLRQRRLSAATPLGRSQVIQSSVGACAQGANGTHAVTALRPSGTDLLWWGHWFERLVSPVRSLPLTSLWTVCSEGDARHLWVIRWASGVAYVCAHCEDERVAWCALQVKLARRRQNRKSKRSVVHADAGSGGRADEGDGDGDGDGEWRPPHQPAAHDETLPSGGDSLPVRGLQGLLTRFTEESTPKRP